jgi:peptide/nickel transport system substrate-binding protein
MTDGEDQFSANANELPGGARYRYGHRAMSPTLAMVMMVVVIIIVGGAGYVALNAVSGSGNKTVTTCTPANSPFCEATSGVNDVVLFVPLSIGTGQTAAQVAQDTLVSGTVSVSGGESVNAYMLNWGDGATNTSGAPTISHAYTTEGSYIISASAKVGSTIHNGPAYLYPVQVIPNIQTTSSGWFPTLYTNLSNSGSTPANVGWVSGSGTVGVSARYLAAPAQGGYVPQPPTLSTPSGGTQSGLTSTSTGVSASYSFSSPGEYAINMVGPVTTPTGTTIYQNYTWDVYVSPIGVPPGCAQCTSHSAASSKSPHPGQVVYQTVAPGGATSLDPAVAYDTVSAEPIWNVYQTLIVYNKSSVTSYLPDLATCVPGPDCAALYGGNSLIVNNATTGVPEYYTFPIDSKFQFYDPFTNAHWQVYPSDVVFSLARTCGFADLPGVGEAPGWIQCQSFLPNGTASFDGGIHNPYLNTPQGFFSGVMVNDSQYCPAAVQAASNGCVTFNVNGAGRGWSYFYQLIVDPMGGGITSCGWFTYTGAAVPGFAGTSAAKGDGSCELPGTTGGSFSDVSTNATGFKSWLASTPATYWDAFDELNLNYPATQPAVQKVMVGSGPYYLATQPMSLSSGYTLKQNPYWQQPNCAGNPNCYPAPGADNYVSTVTTVYNAVDTVGIEDYQAGTADFSGILPAETAQMLSLVQSGKIGVTNVPTISIFFNPFTLSFNPAAAQQIDPNPMNIPGNFFSYVAVREFLSTAWPYSTIQNSILTTDGIEYGFQFGGAIPQYMGNYYPSNISWPAGNPSSSSTTNGTAAWWWSQATTSGSPYYDPELASCKSGGTYTFPIIGEKGATDLDQMIQDYLPYISSLSGGCFQPSTFDLTFTQLVIESLSAPPGTSNMPFYNLGWAPDYPDPTDYMTPMYYPNATYTNSDAVEQALAPLTCTVGPQTSASTGMAPNSGPGYSPAGLSYWSAYSQKAGGIPQACQGNAYRAMEFGMGEAAGMTNVPLRELTYNMAEAIANHLALYIYWDQVNAPVTYASWINPATIDTNVVLTGGAGAPTGSDAMWYYYGGNGLCGTSASPTDCTG